MKSRLQDFLKEDIGSKDITSELVIPLQKTAGGRIICKEKCVLAGVAEATEVFKELGATTVKSRKDGTRARKGAVVLEVKGSARAILAGERLALNFLMRMSGIATLTDRTVVACRKINPKIKIAATRKTTPGFREFEKKAVLIGGGDPHRYALDDAILIKDNHIRIAGGVEEALKKAKRGSFAQKLEIEVENARDARIALDNGADIIMLDNFEPAQVRKISKELKEVRPNILIEASGGITPENARKYASGADIISMGCLTHSVKSVDFSMELKET